MTDNELTDRIIEELSATAEILQQPLQPAALAFWAEELKAYPIRQIVAALTRLRREALGRFSLALIIDFIEMVDGRPTANEAWALALRSFDENNTVVLNNEIAEALKYSSEIYKSGDEIGARMAFRDTYDKVIAESRMQRKQPEWFPSYGIDKTGIEHVIEEAVNQGKLSKDLLPKLPAPPVTLAGLITAQTTNANHTEQKRERDLEEIRKIKQLFQQKAGGSI